MYELISSCPRCGNPIYVCKLKQQSNSTDKISSLFPKEILPQVIRTCHCSFETLEKEKSLEKGIQSLEIIFSDILKILQKDNKVEEDAAAGNDKDNNKLLKG